MRSMFPRAFPDSDHPGTRAAGSDHGIAIAESCLIQKLPLLSAATPSLVAAESNGAR